MPVALTKNERFSYILEAERLCADRKPGGCPSADKCKGTEKDCLVANSPLPIFEPNLERLAHVYIKPDPASQTVFILRSWSWAERAAILKMVQAGRPQIEFVEMGLRFGLIGWENFKNASGTPVDFAALPEGKTDTAKMEFINGQTWGVELFNEVWRVSYLEEAERKN